MLGRRLWENQADHDLVPEGLELSTQTKKTSKLTHQTGMISKVEGFLHDHWDRTFSKLDTQRYAQSLD
jgi:hypothetical protein